MQFKQKIAPCLWFNNEAEEAAKYYVSIFKNSKINRTTHYGKAGYETHKRPDGSVMTVDFEVDGQPLTALNGGPEFRFSEAISLQIFCDTQQEIDQYWNALSKGGDAKAQVCGWLKDKYGLSWQVVPKALADMLTDHRSEKAERVMEALLRMKKIDIAELERAAAGQTAGTHTR